MIKKIKNIELKRIFEKKENRASREDVFVRVGDKEVELKDKYKAMMKKTNNRTVVVGDDKNGEDDNNKK
jgi:hypothetical protein